VALPWHDPLPPLQDSPPYSALIIKDLLTVILSIPLIVFSDNLFDIPGTVSFLLAGYLCGQFRIVLQLLAHVFF
jgi:hypothetical protein